MTGTLTDYFAADSPLARHLPGFRPRAGQAFMAEAVAEAIATRGRLMVEAGTGTGKTFAYLLPALLADCKTIISTGTKALQDQLYHRDLPLVAKAVGRPVTTALLKGRANYLCLHRLDTVAGESAEVDPDDLRAVHEWRHRTRSGDRAELAEVPEDSSVWPLVTSTADNCLGQKCPVYQQCHVVRARRAAQEADLVVVNHHLLLADLAMKETGFVEFLPGADAVILDEAHQVPDLATRFFGVTLASRELERLADEVRAATLGRDQPELARRIDGLRTAVKALRAAAPRREGRYELERVYAELEEPLERLRAALASLNELLEELADAATDIDNLCERLLDAGERLAHLVADDAWDGLRWLDVSARSVRLHLTPLDVSDTMQRLLDNGQQAFVFTSATLAVGEDFSHFADRLGLSGATGLAFPSPYALATSSLVYLPPGLPPPSAPEHPSRVMEAVVPLLALTAGGVFCLFTSHRALNAARDWCRRHRSRLRKRPLLTQGSAPRDELLTRFREHGNAVLLGTGSFWEGVDVRGPALTVVAIDKLPFASPADPMTMARMQYIERHGGNAFADHQLPQAALSLKQGAGRLLRDESDYGVIVLCDPRILGKQYGRVFLDCLKPSPHTDSLDAVATFFAARERLDGDSRQASA